MANTKIVISGIIGLEVLADDIRKELNKANGAPVDVEINSPGGLVVDGIEMYNLFRMYSGKVTARIMGLAGSMASIIPMACDSVEVFDNSVFFVHLALSAIRGNKNMLRNEADILDGFDRMLIRSLSKKSGKTPDELESLMEKETFFFGADIVDQGFADVLIMSDSPDTTSKSEAVQNAKAQFYACKERIRDIDPQLDKIAAYVGVSSLPGKQSAALQNRTTKPKTETKEKTMNNFEKMVIDYVTAQKCKRSEAIAAVAKQNPAAHEAWIVSYNERIAQKRQQTRSVSSNFPALVEKHQRKYNVGKAAAMAAVIAQNPEAHQSYIAQVNS